MPRTLRTLALALVLLLALAPTPTVAAPVGNAVRVAESTLTPAGLPAGTPPGTVAATGVRTPVGEQVVVAAVAADTARAGSQAWLRGVRASGEQQWLPVTFEPDVHGGATSEPVVLTGVAAVEAVAGESVGGARLVVYSSSVTPADLAASASADASATASAADAVAWPEPRILARSAWGANEAMVRYPSKLGQVTGAMVHHTATGNTYTAEQVPAVLRSIQAFHVNERGWNDIAYNVLIDRFGRAWEGRSGGLHLPIVGSNDNDVTNQRVTNISLLGNHEEVAPTTATMETLAQVVAWKLQRHGVDPYGQTWGSGGREGGRVTLPAIHGHRDERSTLCPGRYVYSQMGALRSRVANIMASTAFPLFRDVPNGAQFAADIRWLAQQGITTGWADATYRPLESVSREATAAFLYRLSGSPAWTPPATSPFPDVRAGDAFHHEITWLAAKRITTGWTDGTFQPLEPVTREAMAAYLYRLYRGTPPARPAPFTDVRTGDPFATEIAWLASTGITTGWPDGTFRPKEPIARDAMAAFLHRAVERLGRPTP